jgi:murein DD-endopeptidase MepM/ murein hydrolase activator NlpD
MDAESFEPALWMKRPIPFAGPPRHRAPGRRTHPQRRARRLHRKLCLRANEGAQVAAPASARKRVQGIDLATDVQ